MSDAQLRQFLSAFILSEQNLQEVYNRFDDGIKKGLGKATNPSADMKCFLTYVQDLPTGNETGKFLALDLGGTNFRVLLVSLKGAAQDNMESKVYAIPKELMTGTGVQLFDHIAKCLSDFTMEQKVENDRLPLGFTFSFPCVQLGLEKAKLVRWTKGFNASGCVDQDVGTMLREAIMRRGDTNIDVVAILNDTTGTLMSCGHRNPECRVGVIVGTGSNGCFVERVENVELLDAKYKNKKHMIINVEWGAFGERGCLDFIRTDYDKCVDEKSINKGKQIFEKMISGMYLGDLLRRILHRAIECRVAFKNHPNRDKLKKDLENNPECFETRHLSDVAQDSCPNYTKTREIMKEVFGLDNVSNEDAEAIRFIAECLSKRSAELVSIACSVLVNRQDSERVVVGVDGSVYRFHPKYDGYMREIMQKFVKSKAFDIMLSEDGSGRGAALIAACAFQGK